MRQYFLSLQWRGSTRFASALFGLLACCWLGGAGAAETHALLIGVGHYPRLPAHRQLLGPPNDVRAVRDVLDRLGYRRVKVLSDERHDALPTRANIMAALDDQISQSRPGDWLVVFFAGHGAQQPVPKRTPTEPDNLDEVFLPRDVGRWNARTGTIENAIVDDEIGAWAARARAAGRHVWLVFDTCHAGDMAKASPLTGGGAARMREVPGYELGVPESIRTAAKATGVSEQPRQASRRLLNKGGGSGIKQWNAPKFVALYAAQSDEPTPEEARPFNGRSQPMGLFTSVLIAAVQRSDLASAGALLKSVNSAYRAEKRVFPNPWGEGDLDMALPRPDIAR